MKYKKNIPSKNNVIKKAIVCIKKSNFAILIVVVAIALMFYVLLLNNIINLAFGDNTTSDNVSQFLTINETTVEKINLLKTSSSNSGYESLPSGRTDLFSE